MTTTDEAAPTSGSAGTPAPTRDPLLLTAVVAAIVLIGIAFRFVIKSDLWLDEALAVNIAHLPVKEIPHWLRHDGAPPLYYLMLHYWMKAFGTSDLAVRSMSGIFGVAALPLAWLCGKRTGGRATAWIAVVVLAANPYAIIYSTSVRMYSMEVFLVFAGILAVRRAFERPSLPRVALLTVLVAVLVYTQYWGFYVSAALALFLLVTIRRSPEHRDAAVRMVIGIAVGVATFAPWIPTFLYQAKHTGTPWGKPLLPPTPIGLTFQDFSGGAQHEGWIMLIVFIVLVFLGTFGMAVNERHIDVDLHAQPTIRWEAAVGAAALVIGTSAAFVSRSAFQSRYASIVFPFFVLVVAHGISCFADRRWRVGVVALVVALGFVGGVRNVESNRTTAATVATILRRAAKPGDVVLYCPDQLGPAVHRLAPPGLDEITYPKLRRPAFVDWVNYKAVLRRHKPAVVAQQVLARAGSHTIWYVSAPGYLTHLGICDALSADLAKSRTMRVRYVAPFTSFEKPGLQEFPAR
ncbi:MAG TPA: glycosyltransferase family 39 protein [Acidimicrobiia bacterium]